MAMRNRFSAHEYVSPPRLSGEGGIVLVWRLLNSAPEDLIRAEKKALKLARDGAAEVQRIMKLRARRRPENMQAEDRALDGCWGAIHDQIEAWTRIPDHPNQQLAFRLLALLFDGGLDFTNTKFEVQVVESSNRLERIEEEELDELLLKLVHTDLLGLLQQAHEAFREKLGVGESAVPVPETAELIEAIRELAFLIANYARVMSAAIDIDDEKTIARFRQALAPLAAYRAVNTFTRTPGGTAPVVSPEPVVSPAPAVDPDTDVIDPEAPIPDPLGDDLE